MLFIGWKLIGFLSRRIYEAMEKREFDPSLKSFVKNLVSILLKVTLLISVLGMLGVEMTSFIAILGAGGLATGAMTNFSTEAQRRVDWKFGIAYGYDADVARKVFAELIEKDERILKDPAPFIALSELGDSSVNFVVRAWVKTPDFWLVFFEMNEKVYKIFPEKGLNIPFPQMDVHLHREKG